jgi:hypothetical protein
MMIIIIIIIIMKGTQGQLARNLDEELVDSEVISVANIWRH